MLIVNQDKDMIINFNEITYIQTNGKDIEIYKGDNFVSIIGYYNTRERAEEVLREMIKAFQTKKAILKVKDRLTNDVMLKVVKMLEKEYDVLPIDFEVIPYPNVELVYEMPKE